jgi:hypothetical protein
MSFKELFDRQGNRVSEISSRFKAIHVAVIVSSICALNLLLKATRIVSGATKLDYEERSTSGLCDTLCLNVDDRVIS